MNNKYIKIVLGLSLISLFFVRCSEDFLEKEPSEFISADQISEASKLKPALQNSNIAGIYSTMYTAGSGGTGGHDDFGQKGYDIYGDMLTGDMVLGGLNYGWYSNLVKYVATTDYTFNENYKVWRYYYRVIFAANQVIDGLGGTDFVPETEEGKAMMGQAKAMRAYAYFYLANFFATEYNPSENILPIYKDTKVPNQPLSSTADVYALIEKDLTEAIPYLENFQRKGKQAVNADVARGLLAYVYSTMGKNAEAATLADKVITSGNYTLMTGDEVTGGFNDVNTSGWMWGVDLTLDMGLDLVSFWGQVDIFSYSYTWAGDGKIINWDLYEKIPADDVRKKQFLAKPSFSIPYYKFYDSRRKQGKQRQMVSDYVYMRVAEMYLLKAENLAKSGDDAGARAALKALLSKRLPKTDYVDGLSGKALLDEIYLQTRIELWGEGKVYLAMKRNKWTIKRASNDLVDKNTTYKYNDPKLTFLIPQKEIENNPQLEQK